MRHLAILTLTLALIIGFAGCGRTDLPSDADNSTGIAPAAPGTNTGNGTVITPDVSFRSDRNHLTVELPANWAAVEGPARLARPFEGQVAFNSWNQADFWAREIQSGNSFDYNRGTVASQVPDGGAYVVLIEIGGPPFAPPYPPEYAANDLDGLWTPHDARKDGGSFIDYYKWGTSLRLDVYCSPDASDATVAGLNALLRSWRFDEAGAPDWANANRNISQPQPSPPQFTGITAPLTLDGTQPGTEIPRGSVVYHWANGVTEVYGPDNKLVFIAKDSEAVAWPTPRPIGAAAGPSPATHIYQVPSYTRVGNTDMVGTDNVTRMYLGDTLILTIIDKSEDYDY